MTLNLLDLEHLMLVGMTLRILVLEHLLVVEIPLKVKGQVFDFGY